jgi:hypothetical protein
MRDGETILPSFPCDGIIGTIRKNVVNHDKNIIILTIEVNRLPVRKSDQCTLEKS